MAGWVGETTVRSPPPTAGPEGFPLVPSVPICPLPDAACPNTSELANTAIAIIVTVREIRVVAFAHLGRISNRN